MEIDQFLDKDNKIKICQLGQFLAQPPAPQKEENRSLKYQGPGHLRPLAFTTSFKITRIELKMFQLFLLNF